MMDIYSLCVLQDVERAIGLASTLMPQWHMADT